jgi:hypothetical protein
MHSYESFTTIARPTSPVDVEAQRAVQDFGADGAEDLELQELHWRQRESLTWLLVTLLAACSLSSHILSLVCSKTSGH